MSGPKEVELEMRAYELMVIIDGDAEDGAAETVRDRIAAAVAEAGGEVKSTDMWGRRRFAYEINHKWEGVYFVMELLGPGGNSLDETERMLRLSDDVVRHKLMRLPDGEAARRGLVATSA
jgi:small subunit ribosomal protein S6